MSWFVPRMEPINSPSPGGCATCYVTDRKEEMHQYIHSFQRILIIHTYIKVVRLGFSVGVFVVVVSVVVIVVFTEKNLANKE